MKSIFFTTLTVVVIFSCNTKQTDKKFIDADTAVVTPITANSSSTKTDAHYFWSAELGQKNGVILNKLRPVATDSLNAPNIIHMLNEVYPEILLQLEKVSNDTMVVKISNSKYLTQQMGSSGPEVYMADVTYNLTEIAGINFVAIMFKKGDHAQPGIFSRTDFVQ